MFPAVSIAMFNQRSGINAAAYYPNDIFAMAGFREISSDLQTAAFGVMTLLARQLGMLLIDSLGRTTLLLFGSFGIVLCLSGVATVRFGLAAPGGHLYLLVGYISFFAISQGAVIWVYLGEVVPKRVRAKGYRLGSSTHWVMTAIIPGLVPLLARRSGANLLVLFAFMVAVQLAVVLFCFPETKRFILEGMQHHLGIE